MSTQGASPAGPASVVLGGKSYRREYIVGIMLLVVVVLLWTSSNFVTQTLFQDGYDKPFLVTYLNTSSFGLYLIPFLGRWWRRHRVKKKNRPVYRGRYTEGDRYQPLATGPDSESESQPEHASDVIHEDVSRPLTIRETADLALAFCFLWFTANWSLNASLNYTTVASATILSSMSGFFTLGIGSFFRVERLTMGKIAAVATSFLGVLLVSISDSSSSSQPIPQPPLHGPEAHVSQPILGDVLALLSAIFYAFYVILLKVRIRSESRVDMQLFFGFVGLFNIIMCWPIGVVLHLAGAEPFELPGTGKAVAAIVINMVITLTSDYLYVIAMLKTTPLVVTIGLSLTIPLAVIGDVLLNKPSEGKVIVGAALVLISFIVVGMDDISVKTAEK